MRPFHQLPFSELPPTPRIAHPFDACTVHREILDTESFGRMATEWRQYGSGPPLVLVHGLMTAGYSWRYVLEPLGADFTLILPDLPGSGGTDKPDRSYHPDRLATWLGEFVETVGARGAPMIGNSLGGYLAMRLVLRDHEAVGRLVNLHSPGVPLWRLTALRAVLSLPGSWALLRWLVHRDPERWVHRNVHYYDESLKSREEARIYAEPLRSHSGVHAFARILHETLDPAAMRDFVHDLETMRAAGRPFPVPLQLVYAEQDPVVPPVVGDCLKALVPSARFVSLPRASHFAHVDATDRFVHAVRPFLQARQPEPTPPSQADASD